MDWTNSDGPTAQRRLDILNQTHNKLVIEHQRLNAEMEEAIQLLKECWPLLQDYCMEIDINKFLEKHE